jgi:GNAT superfamily N-acetyltransferase
MRDIAASVDATRSTAHFQPDLPSPSGHTGPMAVRIRPARLDDGPRLQEIERLAGERFRTVGMAAVADDDPPSLDELAVSVAAGRTWVATDHADRAVGYVLAAVVDGTAHVEQVTVDPAWQSTGVGTALLATVDIWRADQGLDALTLTTFADVPWNGPLYTHLGFAALDEEALSPGLAAIRRREVERGLDALGRRMVMRRDGTATGST